MAAIVGAADKLLADDRQLADGKPLAVGGRDGAGKQPVVDRAVVLLEARLQKEGGVADC